MKKRCYIWLLLLVFLHQTGLNAQPFSRYNTFSYSVNEGLLQTTMADMEVDKNNFCWLSFPNGIQKFDGNNFINVKVQPGLPDDKAVLFFRCHNGDLLISHSRGISKYDISANLFTQVYRQIPALQKPVIFIGEDAGIIYFYDETAAISGMNSSTFKIVTAIKTGFPEHGSNTENSPNFSDNIIDHKIALWINTSLCLWDLQKGKLVYQPVTIANSSRFFLQLQSGYEVLYTDYKTSNALQCWNFASGTNKTLFIEGKDDKVISRCAVYPWHDKILLCFDNRLFETDSTLKVLKSELVNFQNQPVARNMGIAQVKEDNFGNLYLQTVNGGIRKIIHNNYPVKYYGTLEKEENSVLSILPDKKNNRVLVGTNGKGLLVFDTLQRLIKHIRVLPDQSPYFAINSIIKDNKGNYILFAGGERKIWTLSPDLSRLTSASFSTTFPAGKSGIEYFGNTLFQNKDEAVTQSMSHLYRIKFNNNSTSEHIFSTEYIMSGLWYDDMVISHGNNELIFLDGQSFKELKKIPFANTGGVRCFARAQNGDILIGSNKGIFKTDVNGKIIYHWNKENGLPDECIYAMAIDNNGALWCSSNKGIFRINSNNNVLQLTKEDGLQENEFNTSVVAQAEDGELYFGGVNGVSSFYPSGISAYEEKLTLLFTKIRANNEEAVKDSAAWNVDRIILPYNKNALSFDFIAMGNNNPDQYIYQYRMDGVDKEWIQNSGVQTVRYSLPPGRYTFKVYASRSFNKDAKPMKEILILIRPPFWKTWWFMTAIIILLLSLLAYIINEKNKRKYDKKLQQIEQARSLEVERERISKDLHDSLGAYANAVLYNTELLEKEKAEVKREELISDLKFASKDIITSLRETVWALKKEKYTAEDCLVRVRNFIQPFARYYSHINFRVEGDAPAGMELHYTKALNLVRIIQESISNSIKHASPDNIILSSNFIANKWQLTIADDGKGFDYHAMKEQERGNGLDNIEHRAAESGFSLSIQAEEKKGTAITIII